MIRALTYHTRSIMFSYFYAFVNDLIPEKEFENRVYSSLDILSQELCNDPELFTTLLECDYRSDNDVEHLKYLLRNRYDLTESDSNYEQFINSSDDEELIKIMNEYLYVGSEVIFDCTGIDTKYKLHKKIQVVFKFSEEYYSKNWYAFEDCIAISHVCVIKIINLSEMRKALPRDTEIFLKIIKKYMSENCRLIFE